MYSTNLEDQAGSVPTYLTLALGTSISACRIHPVYGRQAAVSELPEMLGLGWQATARHKSLVPGYKQKIDNKNKDKKRLDLHHAQRVTLP